MNKYCRWRFLVLTVFVLSIVTVCGCAEQELTAPFISCPNIVDAGEMVSFTVNEASGAAEYYISVLQKNDDLGYVFWETKTTYALPGTYSFLAEDGASYTIAVLVNNAVGESRYTNKTIRVRTGDRTVLLTAEQTEVLTGNNYTLYATAPDADEITVFVQYGRQGEQIYTRRQEGNVEIFGAAHWNEVTSHTYRIEARFKDEIISSDPVTISIIAPYGIPEEPEIIKPEKINTGKSAELKIKAVPYADTYQIAVYYSDESVFNQTIRLEDFQDGISPSIVLQGYQTQRPGNYVISVWAHGIGTLTSWTSTMLQVGELNDSIIFLPFQNEAKISEYIQFQSYAPFATAYRIECLEDNGEKQFFPYGIGGLDRRDSFLWNTPGRKKLTLFVEINGKIYQRTAEVMVSADGEMQKPVITVPYQVNLGQPVTINVAPIKEATSMYISVWHKLNNGTNEWIKNYEDAGSYTLESDDLSAGTYFIEASANGAGYGDASNVAVFHVGTINKEIKISAQKAHVLLNEQTELWFDLADADWARVICVTTQEELVSPNDCFYTSKWTLDNDQAGLFEYRLEAGFDNEIITASTQIEVALSTDQLPSPAIQLPKQIQPAQDIHFHIEDVPGSNQYRILVVRLADGVIAQDSVIDDINKAIIYADWLPFSGDCELKVIAMGKGYLNSVPTKVLFHIGKKEKPELSTLNTIILPLKLNVIESEAFLGNYAERVILPETITQIDNLAFSNCRNLQYINFPDSLKSIADDAFEGCGVLFVECTDGSVGKEYAEKHGFYTVAQ